jgi:hypothetical protein
MPRKPRAIAQLKLRIREDLRAKLEKAAKKRAVSLNFEMTSRLSDSLDRESLFTLGQVAQDIAINWARFGNALHNAELFDQLITVTTALLETKCADAVVDEAKALLSVIAQAKRIAAKGEVQ